MSAVDPAHSGHVGDRGRALGLRRSQANHALAIRTWARNPLEEKTSEKDEIQQFSISLVDEGNICILIYIAGGSNLSSWKYQFSYDH